MRGFLETDQSMTDLSKMKLAQADAFAHGWIRSKDSTLQDSLITVNPYDKGFIAKGWKARQKAARRKSL